jgi:ectoine hydroxylase-related dioxygenase (phytanoyl-CoA dioxygenase family)
MGKNESYMRNGFIIIDKLLSAEEIKRIFAEISAIYDTILNSLGKNPSMFADLDAKYIWLQVNEPKLKSHAYDITKHLPSLLAVSSRERLVAIARELAGDEVVIQNSQIRADDRTNQRMTAMHQEGYGQFSPNAITAWIPLIDVSPDQGTLGIIPGSHHKGYLPHKFYTGPGIQGHGVREECLQNVEIQELNMRAGNAIIFDARLIHGTIPNRKESIRWTVTVRFSDLGGIAYLRDADASILFEQIEN